MVTIKSVQDFQEYMKMNRDRLTEQAIRLENIPKDDEWIQDNAWDEIYRNEETKHGKV